MNDFSAHEKLIMEKLTPEHRDLMQRLTPKERRSMEQHVTPENIQLIQSWIGTDREIRDILFWDVAGKYDGTEWQSLKPVDDRTAELYRQTKAYVDQLIMEAVEIQRRSDLTLFSQFNSGLLFSGLGGAVRSDAEGKPDEKGGFFKGVELRCIGSVGEQINRITLYPLPAGEIEVHLGNRLDDRPAGIRVYTGDSHSLLQLAQLMTRGFPKFGVESNVTDTGGKNQDLNPQAIRKAMMTDDGPKRAHPDEMLLFAARREADIGKALEAAGNLSRTFYERFGLETECYKIGKDYPNFVIMREENTDRILPPSSPVSNKGLVMITATNVCRRCRRELKGFRDFARNFPDVTFALVNLSSPQFKFYERVFGDMGDGDPDKFRKTAAGVTPFVIVYVPDQHGILKFAEYYSTAKAEDTPSVEKCMALFDRYFR